MATETPLESSQSGEAELPTPQFSEKGDSSTSSGADEIVSKLLPHLEQIIERKVQSTKDKRFSEIEKALGGRSKVLAELEELGQPVSKEALGELRLRELEERLTQPTTQPAQVRDNGLSQQRAATTEAIAELNKYGLSSDDADFLALLRGTYPNRAAFDLEVSRHIVKKIAPPKPANPADVVQPPVRASAVGEKSPAQLETDYQKEILEISQSKRGDEKLRAIAALKAKYREAGLNKL
jgi:hypothetical protein